MFTSLVSWLLVACVPGLLMLAALGLGRLERDLSPAAVTATDVDEFLDQAEAVDVHTLAREGMPEALEFLHLRQARELSHPRPAGRHALPSPAAPRFAVDSRETVQALVAVRMHAHSGVNPEFTLTRYVNRV
ncbi:hypothetical protein [Mycobacterium sp. 050134]|uniref:hypothetical protein n=1 Tax=Mycobacterium sp. 050134 TaxID=3096111 RepID=UPI002ED90E77